MSSPSTHDQNNAMRDHKTLCFRFDVDTPLCASVGVPNLITLAEKLGVRFTFFFNMGRSVSRKHALKKLFRPKSRKYPTAAKLSNLHRLGLRHYLHTAMLNPEIGRGARDIILHAYALKHEIGLHGGRNHGEWQHDGMNWSADKFRDEIEYGLELLKKIGITNVPAFASPGWQGSPDLVPVLITLGFKILADIHDTPAEDIRQLDNESHLVGVPTNMAGEPGGIGYFENLYASGLNHAQILDHFRKSLESKRRLAIVYDHPCFAGIRGLPIIEPAVKLATNMGFRVTTITDAVHHLGSAE